MVNIGYCFHENEKLKSRRLGDGVTSTIIISAKFINLLTILYKWFHSNLNTCLIITVLVYCNNICLPELSNADIF